MILISANLTHPKSRHPEPADGRTFRKKFLARSGIYGDSYVVIFRGYQLGRSYEYELFWRKNGIRNRRVFTRCSVLVGGGLALFGALIGTILTFWNSHLERRQRQRETIQQKFEELANMIDETVLWFPTLDLCKSNQSAVGTHPPICHRRIATLALIYFPELIDDSRSYSSAIVEYYEWVINAVKLDGSRPLGEMVAELPEYFVILEHTENARRTLQESIRKHAPKYTK